MTTDHIAMLQWIQQNKDRDWRFFSNNFPAGHLWDQHLVARLVGELRAANMIQQDSAFTPIIILQPGQDALKLYADQAAKEEDLRKMTYEQLYLELENLRNQVFDYDSTKKRSKWAFRISIIAVVVAVFTLILKIIS